MRDVIDGPVRRRPARLRYGLPRDPEAVGHMVAYVVSAVATIMLTRGFLAATGFPQIGGAGLHIAHVLWGGLLMIAAQVIALSFIGPIIRPVTAVVGGAGLGLFIDEVGKFVTSDNDYFFQPAPAIMYVVLVLIVLVVHVLHGRHERHDAEYLAGALDYAVSGAVGGLTPTRRQQADDQLRHVSNDVPAAIEAAALLRAIPDDPDDLPDIVRRVTQTVRGISDRVLDQRWIRSLAVVVLAGQAIAALIGAIGLAVLAITGSDMAGESATLASAGVSIGGVSVATLVVIGLLRLRRNRIAAFGWFGRAVLVSLLVSDVFQFAVSPMWACADVTWDLLLLAIVGVEQNRLRREESQRHAGITSTAVRA